MGSETALRRMVVVVALALSLAAGCAPKKPKTPAILLSMSYFHASSALAVDDLSRATEFLKTLAGESSGNLRNLAQTAAAATTLEAMREAFKTLSEEAATNMTYPDGYAAAFCPMYKDGSKWIQKRESPVANPYLGKAKPDCGFFVD